MAVIGTLRTEPYLAEDADNLRVSLIEAARDRNHAAIDSSDWDLMTELQSPRPGDLVVELTRASWTADAWIRRLGFGILLERDGDRFHVQYGQEPEQVQLWERAMFLRVREGARL